MEDIGAMLNNIMQDPQSMNQLREVAKSFGLDPDGPPPPGLEGLLGGLGGETPPADTPSATAQSQPQGDTPPPVADSTAQSMPDISALMAALGLSGGGAQTQAPAIDPRTIKLLQGAMGKLNERDKNVELLRALKPHFSAGRATRVDDAIRILQLISLFPVLKESGLLGDLGRLGNLGGLGGLANLGNLGGLGALFGGGRRQ